MWSLWPKFFTKFVIIIIVAMAEILKKVVVMAEIPKKVVARAEIPKKGGR